MAAARNGETRPPVDMRYLRGLPSKGEKSEDKSRERVVSFLQQVYESVAETLPDVRDDTFDSPALVVEVPELADSYASALHKDDDRPSVKKEKRRKLGIEVNVSRNNLEIRYLPPGHVRDYWEQMKVTEPRGSAEKPVGFSTFWRVWNQEFQCLKFRAASSHSQCNTCLRHKLLIKSFAGHMTARQDQVRQYAAHLQSQYNDRLEYWQSRGSSRLRTPYEVTIIIDGIDQAKFAYPRSPLFSSKDLQGLNRPRAHISGCICHGRFVLFTISPAHVPKDANSCIETIAHCLHLLAQETELRHMSVTIQSDNTTREVKNNHFLRFLASLVMHGS